MSVRSKGLLYGEVLDKLLSNLFVTTEVVSLPKLLCGPLFARQRLEPYSSLVEASGENVSLSHI